MRKPWMDTAICVAMNFAAAFTMDRFILWLAGAVSALALAEWIVWRSNSRDATQVEAQPETKGQMK